MVSTFQSQSYNNINETSAVIDSLRKSLLLDKPLVCDSIVEYETLGKKKTIVIDSKRPNLNRAKIIIDSIKSHVDEINDTTIARIKNVIYDFDFRYQVEFGLTYDYYKGIYHEMITPTQITEFDVIVLMENLVKLWHMTRKSCIEKLDVITGKEFDSGLQPDHVSYTMRTYGHKVDLGIHFKYFQDKGTEDIESCLIEYIYQLDNLKSSYRIIRILGGFDVEGMPDDLCETLNKVSAQKVPDVFISVLGKYNSVDDRKYDCINQFLNQFKK